MIALVVSNQRGGVGKTTTAVNYAGYLVGQKKRVLLIDTDSQGSVGTNLGLRPIRFLSNFIVQKEALSECVTTVNEHLDVLCSNRTTHEAEGALMGQMAREMALKFALEPVVKNYDAVIIDVSPSISLLQTCSMAFAGNVLVPIAMDLLSINGAQSSVQAVNLLNDVYKLNIRLVGFLPTQFHARLQVTQIVTETMEALSQKNSVPILPAIRIDQTIHKAERARQFIFDFDPKCKAAEDYSHAFELLTSALEAPRNGQQQA